MRVDRTMDPTKQTMYRRERRIPSKKGSCIMNRKNFDWRFDGRRLRTAAVAAMVTLLLVGGTGTALAQEEDEDSGAPGGQSLESAANDATASMWTFQLSLEGRTWLDEDGPSGQPRPEGNRDQFMLPTNRRGPATPSTLRSLSPSSGPPAAGVSDRRSTSRPRAQSLGARSGDTDLPPPGWSASGTK